MSNANIDPKFALALNTALKKGLDTKTAREETAPGVYRGLKMTVEVEVDEMRVAPDTDKSPTCSIPLLTTCALLLKKFEPEARDRALDIFREVMHQAHDMSKDAQKELLEESGVAELEKTIKEEIIGKLPRVPVKGAVSIKPDDVRVTIKSMSLED
jgi:hypothetical protein